MCCVHPYSSAPIVVGVIVILQIQYFYFVWNMSSMLSVFNVYHTFCVEWPKGKQTVIRITQEAERLKQETHRAEEKVVHLNIRNNKQWRNMKENFKNIETKTHTHTYRNIKIDILKNNTCILVRVCLCVRVKC